MKLWGVDCVLFRIGSLWQTSHTALLYLGMCVLFFMYCLKILQWFCSGCAYCSCNDHLMVMWWSCDVMWSCMLHDVMWLYMMYRCTLSCLCDIICHNPCGSQMMFMWCSCDVHVMSMWRLLFRHAQYRLARWWGPMCLWKTLLITHEVTCSAPTQEALRYVCMCEPGQAHH